MCAGGWGRARRGGIGTIIISEGPRNQWKSGDS